MNLFASVAGSPVYEEDKDMFEEHKDIFEETLCSWCAHQVAKDE
jgi:hypothetical protein